MNQDGCREFLPQRAREWSNGRNGRSRSKRGTLICKRVLRRTKRRSSIQTDKIRSVAPNNERKAAPVENTCISFVGIILAFGCHSAKALVLLDVNLRLRLFSVTIRTTLSGAPEGIVAWISRVTLTSAPINPDKWESLRLRFCQHHVQQGLDHR